MHPITRKAVNAYTRQIATLNGVERTDEKFTVAPTVTQTLESKIQESADVLKRINIVPVREQMGQKLGLGVGGPAASRTNTKLKDRATRDLSALDSTQYHALQTNFDTHLEYAKLDMWAKFKDFQPRLRDALIIRQALDRIMVGFNGTSAAAETDIVANPMLQDVNKGWLQQLRETAPERVMDEGAAGAGSIKVGDAAGAHYKNLDALVFDALNLMDPWFHNDTSLVVMVGRDLLHDKYFPLVNVKQAPTEELAAQVIMSQKAIGNVQAAAVPFFPGASVLITSWDNLSIYWQEETRRRMFTDNPKRDRYENYESVNEAYVVENVGKAVLLENIELV
ncbi:phage major capsid protein, P2 family [Acidovorax radicis]|uniref:phage major capsid protein, P2 family n=1 Tax=Acidovorax radicis TaxID=758826 RepID=UPI0002376DE9|nr:phage major capsid protein, P2 family [Acidovorax radicis]